MRPNEIVSIAQAMNDTAGLVNNFLDKESVDLIVSYLINQQNEDGGFKGRADVSDLYYTLFGLECMQALKQSINYPGLTNYLEPFYKNESLDFIHLICLIRCINKISDYKDKESRVNILLDRINKFRSDIGGFKLTQEDEHDSVYAGFLAYLTFSECNVEFPDIDLLFKSIKKCKTNDHGYADQPGLKKGTVTVTAAVTILLSKSGRLQDNTLIDWLQNQYTLHGGFRASPLAPIPDLLSTGTTLFALRELGISLKTMKEDTFDFIESVWNENGGFCGHLFETDPDSEYTFYGLLSLGVLSEVID